MATHLPRTLCEAARLDSDRVLSAVTDVIADLRQMQARPVWRPDLSDADIQDNVPTLPAVSPNSTAEYKQSPPTHEEHDASKNSCSPHYSDISE